MSDNRTQAGRWARGVVTVSSANLFVIAMSAAAALLMPLALSVEGYAYWQLFSLYSSFAGFFVLGFNDGIYLRYSHLQIINHLKVFKSFLSIVILLGVAGGTVLLALAQFVPVDKEFAVTGTAVCVLFYGSNGFFAYVNQMRFHFGRYAAALVLEKTTFVLAVSVLFASGENDYRAFVTVSIGAALLKLGFNVASNWTLVAARGLPLASMRTDIGSNFRQGILLMLSVLMCASILVPARLVIEQFFGTKQFGVFSFALTAVSIISLCVLSAGQLFYPMLRRIAPERYPVVFKLVHELTTVFATLVLCSFFLVQFLVRIVYGQYSDMLIYLAYLFPTCVFQAKYILLVLNEQKLEFSMGRAMAGAASGVFANSCLSLIGYVIFDRVEAVAIACLISYVIWFYPWWLDLLRRKGMNLGLWAFADLGVVMMFLLSTVFAPMVFQDKWWGTVVPSAIYVLFAALVVAAAWVRGRPRWLALRAS